MVYSQMLTNVRMGLTTATQTLCVTTALVRSHVPVSMDTQEVGYSVLVSERVNNVVVIM